MSNNEHRHPTRTPLQHQCDIIREDFDQAILKSAEHIGIGAISILLYRHNSIANFLGHFPAAIGQIFGSIDVAYGAFHLMQAGFYYYYSLECDDRAKIFKNTPEYCNKILPEKYTPSPTSMTIYTEFMLCLNEKIEPAGEAND